MPRCWIGKRHLDEAMKSLSNEFSFQVLWKPFLLNPGPIPDEGLPLVDYLMRKFGPQAAERFMSGDSPVSQRGRAVVSHFWSGLQGL